MYVNVKQTREMSSNDLAIVSAVYFGYRFFKLCGIQMWLNCIYGGGVNEKHDLIRWIKHFNPSLLNYQLIQIKSEMWYENENVNIF